MHPISIRETKSYKFDFLVEYLIINLHRCFPLRFKDYIFSFMPKGIIATNHGIKNTNLDARNWRSQILRY